MIKLLIIIVIEKQREFSLLFLDDFMHFISFENKSYFICPFFFFSGFILTCSCFHCFTEKNFSDSQYHFLFTSDGQQCAAMLVENATSRGFPGEADLFVTQAVLQYVIFIVIIMMIIIIINA